MPAELHFPTMPNSMNSFAVLFFIISAAIVSGGVSTVEEIAAEENAKIVQRMNPMIGLVLPQLLDGTEECKADEMSCDDDKLTFCGIDNTKITVSCSSVFDGKPGFCDCDKSQCVAERPVCQHEEDTKCKTQGEKLPDPQDCQQFTYCDGSVRSLLRCPNGFVYSPGNKTCLQGSACNKLKCNPKKMLEWIPFPQAPQYFLFCMFGRGEVRQCSQEEYEMKNNKCQFRCEKPGLFRDPNTENCKKGIWYTCSKKGSIFVKETMNCGKEGGTQRYFNEQDGVCTKTDTCSSSSPPKSPPQDESKAKVS